MAPIVALLVPAHDEDRAAALDAGANDYLVRPFTTADLVARVRVWLKHVADLKLPRRWAAAPVHLRIDRERRCIFVEGVEIHITPLEYRLLDLLGRGGPAGMTEEQLVRGLWGSKGANSIQYLRAHVRQLRQKNRDQPGWAAPPAHRADRCI